MKKEMTITTHIQTLIFMHDCVILPNFGGFVTSYAPAYIDLKSGKVYPPSKKILFNSKLQTNDGILTSHVARLFNTTYSEASTIIDNEITTIKDSLKNGVPCYFDKIGTIVQSKENKFVFEPENSVNFLSSSFGLGATELRNTNVTRVIKSTSNYTLGGLIKYGIAATIALGLVFIGEINFQDNPNVNHSSMLCLDSQMMSWANINKADVENNEIEKVGHFRELISSNDHVEETEELESIVNDVTILEESTNTITNTNTDVKLSHHIIVGCFSNEKNIRNTINQLINDGYQPSIQGVNKKGLTRVSINSYSSYKEAEKALIELSKEYNGAWILHD